MSEDDFEREWERAKQPMVRAIPPQQTSFTRCMKCGREGARMRVAPSGDRLVCTGVFEANHQGVTVQVDCYDRIEREHAEANGAEYERTKKRVAEENARKVQASGRAKLKAGDW